MPVRSKPRSVRLRQGGYPAWEFAPAIRELHATFRRDASRRKDRSGPRSAKTSNGGYPQH
jgi:hypothetical protein